MQVRRLASTLCSRIVIVIFKLISCDVLTREVCHCIARSPHAINPVFLPKGEHIMPGTLRALLQDMIDAAGNEAEKYEAILLGYGLCGNAINGLIARDIPLVIPRAHDCTTLFLGSLDAFAEHFGSNPSQCWTSVGYSERGGSIISEESTRDYLGVDTDYRVMVEQYGEENARYILETMKSSHVPDCLYFLDVPETREASAIARICEAAESDHLPIKRIAGSLRLIEMLISGEWPDSDFLTVPPAHRVEALYDMEKVISIAPV